MKKNHIPFMVTSLFFSQLACTKNNKISSKPKTAIVRYVKMLEIKNTMKLKVPTPLSIKGERVDFKVSNLEEVVFNYPPVGVTPPVSSTKAKITHLGELNTKEKIVNFYQQNISIAKPDLAEFKTMSGNVFEISWQGIPQGESHVFFLHKNVEKGSVLFGPITNLKFNWQSASFSW